MRNRFNTFPHGFVGCLNSLHIDYRTTFLESIYGWGEAVRELKSYTSESYDLKAISEIAIENEAFSSKNSLKNAVEYRDNFQSVSSRHLENEFLDGLGGGNWQLLQYPYSFFFQDISLKRDVRH